MALSNGSSMARFDAGASRGKNRKEHELLISQTSMSAPRVAGLIRYDLIDVIDHLSRTKRKTR